MKTIVGLLLSLVMSSCGTVKDIYCSNSSSCNTVVSTPTIVGDVVYINKDTIIESGSVGKTYVVTSSTADFKDNTIDGRVGDSRVSLAVRLVGDNATVKNVRIVGYRSGVGAMNSIPASQLQQLKGVSKVDAGLISHELRLQAPKNQSIINVHISDTEAFGIYVQHSLMNTHIKNVEMVDIGTMGIYVDHGALRTHIEDTTITNCGYNHVSGREGIAVDATLRTLIERVTIDGCFRGGIFSYTNWGEDGVTRPINDFTVVKNSFFENMPKGVSIAARHMRRFAGATKPDYSTNATVSGNVFDNIELPVEHLDLPFVESGNETLEGETIKSVFGG